jgi:hypothetical protein
MLQLNSNHETTSTPACHFKHPLDLAGLIRGIVENTVCMVFNIDLARIQGPSRGNAEVALARQIAMYLMHVSCEMSQVDVGRLFHRDRTTVRHACAVIEDRRDDAQFEQTMVLVEQIILRRAATSGISLGVRRPTI